MSNYSVGDILDVSDVYLDRFEFRDEAQEPVEATKIKIVELPSKGKPVAVVYEMGDRTGSNNDILGGNI